MDTYTLEDLLELEKQLSACMEQIAHPMNAAHHDNQTVRYDHLLIRYDVIHSALMGDPPGYK